MTRGPPPPPAPIPRPKSYTTMTTLYISNLSDTVSRNDVAVSLWGQYLPNVLVGTIQCTALKGTLLWKALCYVLHWKAHCYVLRWRDILLCFTVLFYNLRCLKSMFDGDCLSVCMQDFNLFIVPQFQQFVKQNERNTRILYVKHCEQCTVSKRASKLVDLVHMHANILPAVTLIALTYTDI